MSSMSSSTGNSGEASSMMVTRAANCLRAPSAQATYDRSMSSSSNTTQLSDASSHPVDHSSASSGASLKGRRASAAHLSDEQQHGQGKQQHEERTRKVRARQCMGCVLALGVSARQGWCGAKSYPKGNGSFDSRSTAYLTVNFQRGRQRITAEMKIKLAPIRSGKCPFARGLRHA